MSGAYACSTIFFYNNSQRHQEIAAQYEATAEPANGYLTRIDHRSVLVDALASETADWARQVELAASLTDDYTIAISVFIVGNLWALALARNGQMGPVAAYTPDNPKTIQQISHKLLAIEGQLVDLFPDQVDAESVDAIFGALLETAISPEDGIGQLLEMLECSPNWLRWSWFETIPEQLFIDPDLADCVTPLGEARHLWEE